MRIRQLNHTVYQTEYHIVYGETGIWSTGYFVSTVGLNEAQIRKYIERQNAFDRGFDLTGEFS